MLELYRRPCRARATDGVSDDRDVVRTTLDHRSGSTRSDDECVNRLEEPADLFDSIAGERPQRRTWIAAFVPREIERGLEAGNAEPGGDGARERDQPLLQ